MARGKVGNWPLTVVTYNREIYADANHLATGAQAPTNQIIAAALTKGFDDANDEVLAEVEVPDEWDGSSDALLYIYWVNEQGSAIPDTKKVIWAPTYWVTAINGTMGSGTVATPTAATYTQSGGAGTDGTLHRASITLARLDANQPLVKGSTITMSIKRDTATEGGDTYAADACIVKIAFVFQVNDLIALS